VRNTERYSSVTSQSQGKDHLVEVARHQKACAERVEEKHGDPQYPPTVVVYVEVMVFGRFQTPVGAAGNGERVNVPGGVWVTTGARRTVKST